MEFKYTKVALALSAALLVGCGSDSESTDTSTPIEYVTELTAEQITSLEEAGLSAEEIAAIIVGDMTQSEVDAAVAEAIAEATGTTVSYSALIIDEDTSNAYIRHNVATAAQAEGSLSVNIKVNPAEEKLSYISLFPSTSTSTGDAVLDLKMGSNAAGVDADYPDTTDNMVSLHSRQDKVNGELNDDDTGIEIAHEWVNVTLAWSQTAGTVEITVTSLEDDSVQSYTADMYNVAAVTRIAFKTADSSGVSSTTTPYYIDDVMVYDADGNVTFEDSFDTLTALDNWDTISGTPAISADENTTEGTETGVIEYQTELTAEQVTALTDAGVSAEDQAAIIDGDMTEAEVQAAVDAAIAAANTPDAANQYAQITDTCGKVDDVVTGCDSTDTGELRYAVDSSTGSTSGTVSFKMYYPSSESETLKLNLFDGDTKESTMFGMIRFDSGNIQDGAKADIGTFTTNQWLDVEVAYSVGATLADSTISLTIGDAEAIAVSAWNSGTDFTPTDVRNISFMLSSNSGMADDYVGIDDLVIDTNTGGVELDDDFEGYEAGTMLGTDQGYKSNTFSVEVVAETAE